MELLIHQSTHHTNRKNKSRDFVIHNSVDFVIHNSVDSVIHNFVDFVIHDCVDSVIHKSLWTLWPTIVRPDDLWLQIDSPAIPWVEINRTP